MSDRILTADGARYWLAMDGWAHDEAAWLLQGFDPHRLTAQSVRVGGRMVLLPPPEPDPQDPFVAMLSRAGEAAALRFPAPPADVIEWAMKKGLRLPAPLIPDGAVVRAGRWIDLATNAGEPSTEPVPGDVAGTPKVWTPERLEELRAYRDAHGTTKAAKWAKVSTSRVRALLPSGKPATKGYSAFTQRPK